MHCSVLRRQPRTPFESASAVLRRTARGVERQRVRAVQRRRREGGTNELHKAQYTAAFVEARSDQFAHQRRLAQAALATVDVPPSPAPTVDPAAPLLELAHALEQRTGPRARTSAPVTFGAWRSDDAAALRASRAADFIPHCILREATTPPGWSLAALRRTLPLAHGAPAVGKLWRHLRRASALGQGADEPRRFLAQLRRCEAAVAAVWPDPAGATETHTDPRTTLASLVLQELTASSQGWALGLAYLQAELTAAAAGEAPPIASAGVAQRIAVWAESVRYLDLPPRARPPLSALEQLLTTPGPGLSAVVAAPLLSITDAPGEPAAVETFCARRLVHGRGPVFLPAAAWGHYLRALHRSGAGVAEIQRAVDTITDPARTLHAERLLASPHVWAGYLASVDGPHALDVFVSNRRHYGLRETPATVAAVMASLARGARGVPEQVEEGLKLYRTLLASAGRYVVGTASVLAALADLHAAAGDLHSLLALSVDHAEVLLYFGVSQDGWRRATAGAALHERLQATARTDTAALLARVGEHRAYWEKVCAMYEVPPLVQHAFLRAMATVEERWTASLTAAREDVPMPSAEDLADLMG